MCACAFVWVCVCVYVICIHVCMYLFGGCTKLWLSEELIYGGLLFSYFGYFIFSICLQWIGLFYKIKKNTPERQYQGWQNGTNNSAWMTAGKWKLSFYLWKQRSSLGLKGWSEIQTSKSGIQKAPQSGLNIAFWP